MSEVEIKTYKCDKKDCDKECSGEGLLAQPDDGWWSVGMYEKQWNVHMGITQELHFCSHLHLQEGLKEQLESINATKEHEAQEAERRKKEEDKKREKEGPTRKGPKVRFNPREEGTI